MVRYVDPPDGARLEARAGEPFTITLPENPTTGYLWQIASNEFEPVGQPQFESASDAVGAGGNRTFGLQAPQPGESVITLTLKRPRADSSAQTRRITVSVR